MRPKSDTRGTAEQIVKEIKRATRKHYAAEDKKELVADLTLENRLLKKSMIGDGGDQE